MKVLTFLGPTQYAFTKYRYKDKVVPTRFFAEALPHFFPDTEKILAFVTPTVREHSNLEELQSHLGDLLEPVPIPESHDENALWDIFDALTNSVQEGERVVFDITNSFRSLPFLVFIAAAFLRSARKVKVEAVVYGAYEARDKETNVSPVFDLTPFISLFDWLTATNQFIYTGSARYLARQLEGRGEALAPLAQNVRDIALGLDLLRPRHVAEAAQSLPENLAAVQQLLPRPFGVVAQQIENAYGRFQIERPDEPREHLRSQLRMINWYYEKERYVHALSMAREWLVSLVCVEFNLDLWDRNERSKAEFLLNYGGYREDKKTGEIEESPYRDAWKRYPYRKTIAQLWQGKERGQNGKEYNLANLRNDVLHAGFRKGAKPANEVIAQTGRILERLNRLAADLGLTTS